jgi:hypothetical protein
LIKEGVNRFGIVEICLENLCLLPQIQNVLLSFLRFYWRMTVMDDHIRTGPSGSKRHHPAQAAG